MSRRTNEKLDWLKTMLHKVRPAGKGWIARCPAHDDKQQSLSLAVGKNGHVLLHCFCGCPVASILRALDITAADLFENGGLEDMSDEERRQLHQGFAQAKWATALETMQFEAVFLDMVARHLADGGELDTASQRRLQRSVKLLDEAFVTLTTGPNKPRAEYHLPVRVLDKYEESMPTKSGWRDDDKVPRSRGRRASQPRTASRQGRRVPDRRKSPE